MDSGEPDEAGKITKQLLKHRSREFDIESIHTISLSRLDLNDISAIGECVGLERLDLSYNDINRLFPLVTLTSLVVLDISANRITSLDGLQQLDNLEKLNAAGNLISGIGGLKALRSLDKLTNLRLNDTIKEISNPLCMRETYQEEITTALPQLINLDGQILKGPGSELFKLFAELDKSISADGSSDGPIRTAQPPTPLDMADFVKKASSVDSVLECDSEDSLTARLAECNSLSQRGESLLAEAQDKLREHERV